MDNKILEEDKFDRRWGWIVGLIMFLPLNLMPSIIANLPVKIIIGQFVVFFIINMIIHHFLIRKT